MDHPAVGFGIYEIIVPIRMRFANLKTVHGAEQWPTAGDHAQFFSGDFAAQDVGDGVVNNLDVRGDTAGTKVGLSRLNHRQLPGQRRGASSTRDNAKPTSTANSAPSPDRCES
jgi:hypothetical protein